MKKAGLLSMALGFVGGALALVPWLYLDQPGLGAIVLTCIGAILAGIARADVLSDMLGRGNPGDEFIRDCMIRVKTWFTALMRR